MNEDDWVRLEVCRAMARNKNIIPVMLNGFVWPTPMPLGMEELCNYQALTASSIEYFDLALQRLQERYLLSRRHRSAKRTVMWTGVGLCALAVVVAIGLFVFRIMAKGVCEDYAARMTNHVSRIHVLAEENVGLESDWDKFLKTWERKTDPENRSLLKDDFLARLDVAVQNVKMLIPEDTVTWQISGYDRFLLSLYGINGAELAMYPQMTKLYLTDYMTQLDIYRQFYVPHDIFKVGDIITAMNGIPVKNYDELKAAFKTEGGDGSVRFLRFDGKDLVEHRSPSYGDTSIVGFLNLTD